MQLISGVAIAAVALIRPLAWDLPYAAGTALEKSKTKKQTNKQKKPIMPSASTRTDLVIIILSVIKTEMQTSNNITQMRNHKK